MQFNIKCYTISTLFRHYTFYDCYDYYFPCAHYFDSCKSEPLLLELNLSNNPHICRIDGSSCGYKFAKSLVFDKVHSSLGLDRCKTFVTAAAPLSPDIKKFFLSLDIPIVDAFGMSEASGAHTLSIYPK